MLGNPSAQTPPPRPIAGERLVFWLFAFLASATAVTLVGFSAAVEPQFRPRIYAALVVDLMVPVVAWRLLAEIGRRRAGPPQAKQ